MVMEPTTNYEEKLLQSMNLLRMESKELYLSSEVDVICDIPEPQEFYRKWVSKNVPVLIKGAVKNWPAVRKWTAEYFKMKFGHKVVTVAETPNGYADAINELNGVEYFVMPEERQMSIGEFFEKLSASKTALSGEENGIYYIQKQNSNLTTEFPELLEDIEQDIPWASAALDRTPEAVNLWIGDKKAVSSLHKDPFENIYCVISGYKEFILIPPTDRPWIPYKLLSPAKYERLECGKFVIKPLEEMQKVPWICIDPLNPDINKFPLYKNASPVKVKVHQGDILYLPSLWFHHVEQSHSCIAVNYWYDMDYDIKYAYFRFLESLSQTSSFNSFVE